MRHSTSVFVDLNSFASLVVFLISDPFDMEVQTMAKNSPNGTPDNGRRLPKSLLEAWERFLARFPAEPDCMEELFRRAYAAGAIQCPRCGHTKVNKSSYGQRRVCCNRCGKRWSFTAGTFFHRIRRAQPWLAAILLLEEGVDVNSNQFRALAGIAYSTSWTAFQKIAAAITKAMHTLCTEVASSMFSRLFGKRSRETPARHPPSTELEEFDQPAVDTGRQARQTDSCFPGNGQPAGTEQPELDSKPPTLAISDDLSAAISGQEVSVYELLSAEPTHFDVIQAQTRMAAGALSAALMLLEMVGAVERLPGDRYARAAVVAGDDRGETPLSPPAAEAPIKIDGIINVLRWTYHAISRKYLQPYLARYWCSKDRSRWSLGAVMLACLKCGVVTRKAILGYVSPAMVKVFAET
ncbi:MAG TPA: hypothetical protein V6D08_21315 [Candidatus Obscuribacterales bacterium]